MKTIAIKNSESSPTVSAEKMPETPGVPKLKKGLTITCCKGASVASYTPSPVKDISNSKYETPGLETIHDDHCEE